MRRIWLILFLLLLICYGCAVPLKKAQFNEGKPLNAINIMNQLLKNNERIALAIISGQIYTAGKPDPEWKNRLQGGAEDFWLKTFGNNTKCSIVNRNYLQNNIDEISLSGSGLISEATRVKIGELTGATHLIVIEGTTIDHGAGYQTWTIYWKLIDIKSGKLLTIDKVDASQLKVI